jgi:Fungal Zn(2)-Cys(6) binuclear cluster domain
MNNQASAPRIKAACDRCHGQKLRCPRPFVGGQCSRCEKAGIECVFSVSKRGNAGRILSDRPGLQNVPLNIASSADAMILDSTGIFGDSDFDMRFSNEALYGGFALHNTNHLSDSYIEQDPLTIPHPDPILLHSNGMSNLANIAEIGPSSESSAMPASEDSTEQSFDARLFSFSKQLTAHKSTMRSPKIHGAGLTFAPGLPNGQDGTSATSGGNSNDNGKKFKIDTTFQVTQVLLDIYSDLQGMTAYKGLQSLTDGIRVLKHLG